VPTGSVAPATRYAGDILSTEHPGLIEWMRGLLSDILGPVEAATVLSSAGHA
jgi:hypothetical protein